MNNKTKLFCSLMTLIPLLVVACGNKPSISSEENSSDSQTTSEIVTSSEIEESSSQESISSEESSEDSSKQPCENDLHDYVRYSPVEGGHRKKCDNCDEYLSEKEDHTYFNDKNLYCPACGYYSETMAPYTLPETFNVTVRTADGKAQRRILGNLYTSSTGEYFTLSSPSNAHSSYADSAVEGAKFYYDSEVDDGTKLFMLKETSSKETIGTCKAVYTYTLFVYGGITSGSLSYADGHISIGGTAISDWLNAHTALNQVTYKYLSIQHHADDYRVPVPGTNAVIVEYTCEDCGQFLYQQVIYNN